MIDWNEIKLKLLTTAEREAAGIKMNRTLYAAIISPISFTSYEDALSQLLDSDIQFLSYPIRLRDGKTKWITYETAEAKDQVALEEIADAARAQKGLNLHFLPMGTRPDNVALETIEDKVVTARIYSNTRDAMRYMWDRTPMGNRNIRAALDGSVFSGKEIKSPAKYEAQQILQQSHHNTQD